MILLALAAAFLAGVYAGPHFGAPATALGLFAASSILLTGLLVTLRRTPLPALLLAMVLLGGLRAEHFGAGDASPLAPYHDDVALRLEGLVASDPEAAGTATRFRFTADRVSTDERWATATGDVLVTVGESAELVRQRDRPYFRYGDRLRLEATIEAPPVLEGFDYPAYLARQGRSRPVKWCKSASSC